MADEPPHVAEARSWFRKAVEDLRAADVDLMAWPPLVEDAAFHAHQAAEKSMKAFLTLNCHEFRHTHHLVELGEGCVRVDASLEGLMQRAAVLTEYSWRHRYPVDAVPLQLGESKAAVDVARAVFEALAVHVPRDR